MAALTLGKRSPSAIIYDSGSWTFGNHTFRSHEDEGLGPVDMYRAIVKSSNVYFYSLANELGVDAIHDFMEPLGFGQITGIDIQGEVRGVLPSQEWKRKTYKRPEQQKWYAGETISLGIGQGYNAFTMLQLATATATLANGGHQFTPHLVVGTQEAAGGDTRRIPLPEGRDLHFLPEHLDIVRKAMVGVTLEGTSARAFAGAKYQSAGKTGTAQAVTIGQKEKYNASKLEEHQRAPIARRVFDYWLQGDYPSEEDLAAVSLGKTAPIIGKPRSAQAAWPPKGREAIASSLAVIRP